MTGNRHRRRCNTVSSPELTVETLRQPDSTDVELPGKPTHKVAPMGLNLSGIQTGSQRDLEISMAVDELRRTALHDWHVAHGGRMVDFAGWSLPVFYPLGAIEEHHLTRRSVGMFDIDHMGQFGVRGSGAAASLDRLVTSAIRDVEVGAATYGLLCNDEGGVLDDVIVYRLADDDYMVVVNAANRDADLAWISEHASGETCSVVDRSTEVEMVAVQGPAAVDLVAQATLDSEIVSSLERFRVARTSIAGAGVLIARTGYTGEDGVELYIESGGMVEVWTALLEAAADHQIEAGAIGLSARDSLRFEPGYPLYGHELSEEITPLEARLSWAVDLDGDEFIGQQALRAQAEAGIERRLETIVMNDRGVPREGSRVLDEAENELGQVVSGMFAPTAEVFAANVFLPRTFAIGDGVHVNIREKLKSASVVKRPLYRLP